MLSFILRFYWLVVLSIPSFFFEEPNWDLSKGLPRLDVPSEEGDLRGREKVSFPRGTFEEESLASFFDEFAFNFFNFWFSHFGCLSGIWFWKGGEDLGQGCLAIRCASTLVVLPKVKLK